jgi:hypothetical protein
MGIQSSDLPPHTLYFPNHTDPGSCTATAPLTEARGNMTLLDTVFLRFPLSDFRYSLTLFSKFFASFPHGTCTLSVSHRYLALDGIYHPL